MTLRTLGVALFAATLAIAGAPPVCAASPAASAAGPTAVLETFFERANAVLRSADLERGPEAPRRAIRGLVNEVFDYRDAAERALGPAWRARTPAQQAEFVRLFADFLERGYVAALGAKVSVADGLTIRYLEESVTGNTASVATTLLTRNGSDLEVGYSLVRRPQGWMVRDVTVDGMSLVANYRAQFNRILRTSSYAELIARMQGDGPEASQPVVAAAAPVPDIPQPALAPARPPEPAAPPVSPAGSAPTAGRQELHVAMRPNDLAGPKIEVVRASAPAPAVARGPAPAPPASASPERERVTWTGTSATATIRYWIQVGAFKTASAAAQLAERLRREGIAASTDKLASVPWHPAGALARVRVGPFTTLSDARAKLPGLVARGYAPFIAQARD